MRTRRPSPQTVKVLDALAADPSAWRYGYELGLEVGLQSGSLYPMLVRMCDRDLLEAKWEDGPPLGRPLRHLYRLTLERPRPCGDVCDSFGRAAAQRAPARASRCVIAALVRPGAPDPRGDIRGSGDQASLRLQRGADGDRARLLLVVAVRGLPADRVDWARAMLVELDHVEGRRERWRFSLGCAWAAGRIRLRVAEPGGALLRIVVLGCIAIALALVGYGLLRYPGLRSEPNVWGAMSVFSRHARRLRRADGRSFARRLSTIGRGTSLRPDRRTSGRSRLAARYQAAVRPQGMGLRPARDCALGPALVGFAAAAGAAICGPARSRPCGAGSSGA